MKKKFMNFRFAFLVAIAMIISIILASFVFVSQNLKLVLILICLGIALIIFILFFIFKKKILMTVAIILLIASVPAFSIYFKSKDIDNNKNFISETNTISGKIYKYSKNLDKNLIYIYLNDIIILNDDESKEFYGNLYVILFADSVDTSKLDIGRFVTIKNAEISSLTLNEGATSRDRAYISRGITATSFVFSYNIYFEDKVSLEVKDRIKNKVYKSFENTDTLFTDIGYAMIFGETNVLDEDINGIFRDTGIAHLLSVSGFHISIIVAFLSFIFDKFKTNKYLKFSIIATLLLFYTYLCSFAVSAVRSSVMALLFLHATNRNKEYDKLSALSLAGILILSVDPTQIFNISFKFSFISVLSIILFMPIFERYLSKIFCEKLSSSLSLSLSVSIGIVFFQLGEFKKYPILSFFSNLITVPIVGALFIFLLISIIIGPIFHVTEFLISCFGVLMKYIVQFNNWVANSGLFLVSEKVNVLVLCSWLVFIFVVSDYIFVSKKTKICICGVLAALLNALMI